MRRTYRAAGPEIAISPCKSSEYFGDPLPAIGIRYRPGCR